MTQTQLAVLAGIGLSTVVDFEKERRQVSAAAVEAIQTALKRAGVEFIDENGMDAGVRLRKRQQKKTRPQIHNSMVCGLTRRAGSSEPYRRSSWRSPTCTEIRRKQVRRTHFDKATNPRLPNFGSQQHEANTGRRLSALPPVFDPPRTLKGNSGGVRLERIQSAGVSRRVISSNLGTIEFDGLRC